MMPHHAPIGVNDKAATPNGLVAPLRRLTIQNVAAHRQAAGKLIAGVAAPVDVESYKCRGREHKSFAKKWDHKFSREVTIRDANTLKRAARFLSKPGLISLGGGLPSSQYFPFDEISIKVPQIGHFTEESTAADGVTLSSRKNDIAEGKSTFDISTALNYGQGTGSAQMLRWMVEHTELVHDPPYRDWTCTMTIGSTSALDFALRMMSMPGDAILSEEYTFSAAVQTAEAMDVKVFGVPMDIEGLIPDRLDEILSNWDSVERKSRKPTILYTVPTGQNPTGATQGARRRRHIYKIAQAHDLYILEDEPYYFLQMKPYNGADSIVAAAAETNGHDYSRAEAAPEREFLDGLAPSFLSLDVDGRVMRMDSFSKVIAPGSRLGWITASEQIVGKYIRQADFATQGPCGFAQLVLFKLLDEHWGHAGYLRWLEHLGREYTLRRDIILRACELHLPPDLVSWSPPMAGMFHWLRIHHEKHPRAHSISLAQLEAELFDGAIAEGALILPGSYFYADRSAAHGRIYFRATFAAAPADRINEAIRRFGVAVRASFARHATVAAG